MGTKVYAFTYAGKPLFTNCVEGDQSLTFYGTFGQLFFRAPRRLVRCRIQGVDAPLRIHRAGCAALHQRRGHAPRLHGTRSALLHRNSVERSLPPGGLQDPLQLAPAGAVDFDSRRGTHFAKAPLVRRAEPVGRHAVHTAQPGYQPGWHSRVVRHLRL
ncbi:WG repeat-containing protein [Babesia caballi]|uniref:WG repeat-containing protein n=1 Tax=Babesia caballi TaxID=5871 RepID=A0AAV4LLP5_BABCB|nr:WG repeat-containing protein [Babesia caballi]